MTHPIASGSKTSPSISSGLGPNLDPADKAAHAGRAVPNWSRDTAKNGRPGNHGKTMLQAGIGPRPGSLDDVPVTPRDSDASKKPRRDQPLSSRLSPAAIASAAHRIFNEDIRQRKLHVFLHPVSALLFAGIGFVVSLVKGKR